MLLPVDAESKTTGGTALLVWPLRNARLPAVLHSQAMLLVTGGAGFIGSRLVEQALNEGHDIRVLDDLSTGRAKRVDARAQLVVGDITDAQTLTKVVDGADAIVHLAAWRAVPRSVADPIGTDRVNVGGTLNLLEAARRAGVERVVVASSSSVYGAHAPRPTAESAPLDPTSPYAVSKLASEHYANIYRDLYGMSTATLRLFNVYSSNQGADTPYAQLVPAARAAIRAGRRPVVYGDGRSTRDLVHLDDVVRALLLTLTSRVTGPVNIGSGRAISVRTIVEACATGLGTCTEIDYQPPRPGDVPHTHADITHAATALGWRPTVTLPAGLV